MIYTNYICIKSKVLCQEKKMCLQIGTILTLNWLDSPKMTDV